jgi:hypothetical protein
MSRPRIKLRPEFRGHRSAGWEPPDYPSGGFRLVEAFGTPRHQAIFAGLVHVRDTALARGARPTAEAAVTGCMDVVWSVWGEMPRAHRRNFWLREERRNGR